MNRLAFKHCFWGFAVIFLVIVTGVAQVTSNDRLPDWLSDSTSSDQVVAERATKSLRELGPQGLAAFRSAYSKQLASLVEKPACLCAVDSLERRVANACDEIAGQRDAASSGLYWYTDLAAAKEAAQREGKSILSLHMLGKLTDELSCANSRFFRTTLYSNQEIAKFLRQSFVLHWVTVRPVPKITVDFGDGRRLERTITGNSAHFVLDRSGRVIDVLPGLYAPQAFLAQLKPASDVAAASDRCSSEQIRQEILARYHREAERRLTAEILAATANIPVNQAARILSARTTAETAAKGRVDAVVALDRAAPKAVVERPLVKLVTEGQNSRQSDARVSSRGLASSDPTAIDVNLESLTDEQVAKLAALPASHAMLSPESERLVRAKINSIPRQHLTATMDEVQQRAIADLARLTAIDTARNEYDFHRRIHRWLGEGRNADVAQLNNRIYGELFLTPLVDPWMGLLNVEAFSAIDAYGVVEQK